jgi:ParB family transcriptional regulator, chromosome partitioning protein
MSIQKRLGRGLGGLLQSTVVPPEAVAPEERRSAESIALSEIRPNPYQPRTQFDPAALEELKASIREHGVLQPIIVRRGGGGFEIVAGERRVRACRALGLDRVPAVVREVDDAGMQTLALVENLQREDLNPIEKAKGIRAMMSTQNLTQEAVAARVGKDRATLANLLRLLELPDEVRAWVEEGKLSAGQARAVLQAQGDARRKQLAQWTVDRGLSVRDVERMARLTALSSTRGPRKSKDPFLADIEGRLRRALSAKVAIRGRGRGGVIEIDYADAGELDALLERMHVG